MYVLVALVLTVLVIALAWRGFNAETLRARGADEQPPKLHRPTRAPRPTAPDDDPEFLGEIDRKLRGEDKSN